MKFWDHSFRGFGDVENICMACGFVIPAPTTEAEAQQWMRESKGGEEWWCGGSWHNFDRRIANSVK